MNRIWEKKKNIIMRKFTILKNNDLIFTVGKEAEMFEKLRGKLGKTDKEILLMIIDS